MLVLSRRQNERIILQTADGPVVIVIARVRGDHVRIGIEAPKAVKITRSELIEKESCK